MLKPKTLQFSHIGDRLLSHSELAIAHFFHGKINLENNYQKEMLRKITHDHAKKIQRPMVEGRVIAEHLIEYQEVFTMGKLVRVARAYIISQIFIRFV